MCRFIGRDGQFCTIPHRLPCDDPLRRGSSHEIGDIILRLNREAGVTILFVEQKLPFARRVASEFHLLDKGHRVAGGSFGELTADVVREHLSV